MKLSDITPLSVSQEAGLAKFMGVSIEKIQAKKATPCPLKARRYAQKLMSIAISAAVKAAVLKRRGVLSPDVETTIRRLVGNVGIFIGKGTFKSTFTTLQVFGKQDKLLADYTQGTHSRKHTETLLRELRNDLLSLHGGGAEIERTIPKSGDNYLLESSYLSIASNVQGLSQTAYNNIGK